MLKNLRPVVSVLVLLAIITGIVYPLLDTVFPQASRMGKANGGLVIKDGKLVNPELIGLAYPDPGYFWGRPSATAAMANNTHSSDSGLIAPPLMDVMRARVLALRAADPGNTQEVPVDLVTVSDSGFDPYISLTAAEYQIARVARVSKLSADMLQKLVMKHTVGRQIGMLVEPQVNVLELNLALGAEYL